MMKTIKLIQIVNSVGVCRQHLKTSVLNQKDGRIPQSHGKTNATNRNAHLPQTRLALVTDTQ